LDFFIKADIINNVVNLTIFNLFIFKITGKLQMTPSLANFISSLVAGGIVVLGIGIALVVISKSDRVTRI
jgi:hypothetical protein